MIYRSVWVLCKDAFCTFGQNLRYHICLIYVQKIGIMYLLEVLNGMIQCTKRVGRGFPNTDNFINMIWFKHGRLDIA